MRRFDLKKKLITEFNEHPRRPASRTYLLARQSWRKLRVRRVALDRILCGGEHGLNGQQYARHSGDMTRTSTPVRQSVQAGLLEEYKKIGKQVFSPEFFRQTGFYANAENCLRLFGNYFSATRECQIIYVAENVVRKYRGEAVDTSRLARSGGFSNMSQPPRVFPIRHSDCFQVYDGHHRLAIACARGDTEAAVRIVNPPQLTSLQELLLEVSWNPGKLEVYQPINSPELGSEWQLVRRCTDRFEMMKRFLRSRGLDRSSGHTYLDVACNYGWFVEAMQEFGYQSTGVEVDWAARQIGINFYHLRENQLIGSEAVRFFRSQPSQYDIVSCFSLMHHFVMGRGSVAPEELLGLLSRSTKRVLFFDMGEEHEGWFKKTLAGWDPDSIETWLQSYGNFSEIVRLGTDKDNVPPYEKNYGRTLFACVK